jgi:hypothetical protein
MVYISANACTEQVFLGRRLGTGTTGDDVAGQALDSISTK